MIKLEDVGRQVQTHKQRIGVREMCDKIEAVTMDDLRRVAAIIVKGEVKNVGNGSGAPTVVMQEPENTPGFKGGWQEIQERIAKWGLGRR